PSLLLLKSHSTRSQTDTFHGRYPAWFPARLRTTRTSLHPARGSRVLRYRKCIHGSFRSVSAFLPPHAKNQCLRRKRLSPDGSSPPPRALPSFETTRAPPRRTSAPHAAPSCLRRHDAVRRTQYQSSYLRRRRTLHRVTLGRFTRRARTRDHELHTSYVCHTLAFSSRCRYSIASR